MGLFKYSYVVHKDEVKISDFGMSRFIETVDNSQVTAQNVGPIRWYWYHPLT